jgi:hypothetical protein
MASNVVRVAPGVTNHINVFVNPSASGATQIVAGVAGARYRVVHVAVVSTAANNVKFQTNTTDISATFPLGANGGIVLPFNEHGHFTTLPGDPLNINMSAATATGVQIQYVQLINAVSGVTG